MAGPCRPSRALWIVAALLQLGTPAAGAAPHALSNGLVSATFDSGGGGLTALVTGGGGGGAGRAFGITGDSFSVTVGGVTLSPNDANLTFQSSTHGNTNVSVTWAVASGGTVTALYTLEPGWRVLSKRLLVELPAGAVIGKVELLGAAGANVSGCSWATDYGKPEALNRVAAFHRCGDEAGSGGLMLTVSNPFGQFASGTPVSSSAAVKPGVKAGYSNVGISLTTSSPVFTSDHLLLGTYHMEGGWIRPHSLSGVDKSKSPPSILNTGERDAFVAAVETQLLPSPDDGKRTVKVNVAWDENDYQIDLATDAGRTEYKRIIDRNSELGISHIVFAPTNTDLQVRASCTR